MSEEDVDMSNLTAVQLAFTNADRELGASDLTFVSNGLLKGVHSPSNCADQPWGCWVHTPKSHALASAPIRWRDDKGTAERICDHGISHPDPQDVAYWWSIRGRDVTVHACDGCCGPEPDWLAEIMGRGPSTDVDSLPRRNRVRPCSGTRHDE